MLLYGALRRDRNALDGLTQHRILFLAFVSSMLLYLFVLSFIAEWNGEGHVEPFLLLIVVVGLVGLIMVQRPRNRPLFAESLEKLAASYRTNFFLGVAFAELPALVSFVGVFLTNKLWVYLVGLGFSLLGLALLTPTRADIERRQQQIAAQGSPLSLLEALMAPPPAGRGGRHS